MKRSFCTYFDHRYLTRGMALYVSLKRFHSDFSLWILCLDSMTWDVLQSLKIPEIRLVSLEQLENHFPEMVAAKANRNLLEYYFTCTPAFISFVLDVGPDVNQLTYLDADLYFFSGTEPVFEEIGDSPIAVVEHRYSTKNAYRERSSGRFNVSWVTFRRDSEALTCLESWRRQCLDWCYDRVDSGLFGDQRYLDQWPQLYPGLCVIRYAGLGCAPWNVDFVPWSLESERVLVGNVPLCFFHFHGIRRVSEKVYDPVLAHYDTQMNPVLQRDVYVPYVSCLLVLQELIFGPAAGPVGFANLRHVIYSKPGAEQGHALRWIRHWISVIRRVWVGEYFVVWNQRSRLAQAKATITGGIPALRR